MKEVRLDKFDSKKRLDRGVSKTIEGCWYLIKTIFFLSPLPWPYSFKRFLLKLFGAKIGQGLVIKPRVNIHFPWKLELGDHVWLGEEVFILNFEMVSIGSNVCVSQRAFLCGGNHDYKDEAFQYRNDEIHVEDGVWIGAQSFVSPGSRIRMNSVIKAGSVVSRELPANSICAGNPCEVVKKRW